MKQRQNFGYPKPRLSQALFKGKKYIGKQKQGSEKQRKIKTEKIDVGNTQGEHDSDGSKEQSCDGDHQENPKGRRHGSKTEECQHDKEAPPIDGRPGDRPQYLAGENIVRFDGCCQYSVVGLLKNKPDINVIGDFEARSIHSRCTNQARGDKCDVARPAHLRNISADADTDGKEIEDRLEEIGQD